MNDLTERDLEILRHSLGLNERTNEPYRNNYAANPGDLDYLVDAGAMFKGRAIPGGLQYYHVTPEGIEAAKKSHEARKPKLTRSQRRYRDYLRVDGCFDSFGHYLKYQQYKAKQEKDAAL